MRTAHTGHDRPVNSGDNIDVVLQDSCIRNATEIQKIRERLLFCIGDAGRIGQAQVAHCLDLGHDPEEEGAIAERLIRTQNYNIALDMPMGAASRLELKVSFAIGGAEASRFVGEFIGSGNSTQLMLENFVLGISFIGEELLVWRKYCLLSNQRGIADSGSVSGGIQIRRACDFPAEEPDVVRIVYKGR